MRAFSLMAVCGIASLGVVGIGIVRLSAQAGPSSTWSGIYTESQATRGAALYAENCAQCHRPDLSGGDLAPPLTGPAFFSKWDTRSLADLFNYQVSAMPMTSPGGLSAQQNADLIAFLLRQGGYPRGERELSATIGDLKPIKILAARP